MIHEGGCVLQLTLQVCPPPSWLRAHCPGTSRALEPLTQRGIPRCWQMSPAHLLLSQRVWARGHHHGVECELQGETERTAAGCGPGRHRLCIRSGL